MTHTLHRFGTIENLKDDYIVIARCEKGINDKDSRSKLLKLFKIFRDNNVVNYGDPKSGTILTLPEEELEKKIKDGAPINGVFKSIADVINVIKAVIDDDLGLSIVISGLNDDIKECCNTLNINPHTVNNSLGLWGRTDLLPGQRYLEILTMCGHGLIGVNLIKYVVENIKTGEISLEEGAIMLGKGCMCGIFNIERSKKILKELATSE